MEVSDMEKVVYAFEELPPGRLALAGGKASSLVKLHQAGYPVPRGFVILPVAFSDDQLKGEAWQQVQDHLEVLRSSEGERAFAVRSSGRQEDSEQASFAGEFESRLGVRSDEQIREAIHQVHRSRHGDKVKAYSQARGITETHQVAVVVQQLVDADRSGVLFTANPTNGIRSQAVISAAWGLGESVVGGTVTPDTVIVDIRGERVLSYDIARKEVMTVRTKEGTQEQTVPESRQQRAVLSKAEAVRLARIGDEIETLYGVPMDIEWAVSNDVFFILQARPITALPDPPPPSRWRLPRGAYIAMRVNIIELMAEPLSPLFETMGLQVINESMGDMMTEFLGRPGVMPETPIISVHHYAYYNGSLKPLNMLKILFDSVGIARRMFRAPVERWTEQGRPEYVAKVETWETSNWRERSNGEIWKAARELAHAAIDAYWSMVGGLLPAAWISEGLFTFFYRMLVKRRDDPEAFTFLLGFDSLPIEAEKSLYDLALWARQQGTLAVYLADTSVSALVEHLQDGEAPRDLPEGCWSEWRERFQDHLDRYGHTIYNLDFANPVPADGPAPVLETLKMYLQGEGVNPHTRQAGAIEGREEATRMFRARLSGWRVRQFDRWLIRAQRYAPMREDALADVGLSYPLLRQMLGFLGQRLTEAGTIDRPDEIYWLTEDELQQACRNLDRNQPSRRLSHAIPERRVMRRSASKASPPMMLPHIALPWLGRLGEWLSSERRRSRLSGVGASAGRVTARACVLRGPEDFEKMGPGEVLVAVLTTPAWTPLFARAAAIVTDVGGPLSHGSIVAREYGIPAVLGTGKATERIVSGQLVTVDGDKGVVYLQPDDAVDEDQRSV
jgi:phosphohistidine swiveling domain-containing protein